MGNIKLGKDVSDYVKKNHLWVHDSYTSLGLIASQKNYKKNYFLFLEENRMKELNRLNETYSLKLGPEIFDRPLIGNFPSNKSLSEISDFVSRYDEKIFIGMMISKLDRLYIEWKLPPNEEFRQKWGALQI